MRWVFGIVLLAWLTAASCDRRPEGPLLKPPATSEPGPKPAISVSAPKDAETPPKRCMVPMSAEPQPKPKPATRCPTDPAFGGPTLKKGKVTFSEAAGAPTIQVELAIEPRERMRGLMYRTKMAENAGMLFDFPGRARIQSFWMRNTCIPLDMLFIAEDGYITGIQENVPTLNDGSRSIPCPVRYVLEVNAGWTRAHGVRPGQFVKLPEGSP